MAVPSLSARAVARACLGLTGRLSARRDLIIRESGPPLSLRAELGFVRRSRCGSPTSTGPHHVGRRRLRIAHPSGAPVEEAIVYYPATRDGENAPAFAGGSFPLIGFAHGLRAGFPPCPNSPVDASQDYLQYSAVLEHLVRWGYIAISTSHSLPLAPVMADLLENSIRQMLAENARPGSPFAGVIREDQILLAGHSTGGSAAVILAARGTLTVTALGLLAPGSGASNEASRVEAPLLVVVGTEEGAAGAGDPEAVYRAARPPKHLVVVEGANHFGFTDALCILDGDPPASIDRADQQRSAFGYLTGFFQRYVRGEKSHDAYLAGELLPDGLDRLHISVEHDT